MGARTGRGFPELLSVSKSIFFIENRPLTEYFLLSIRKNAPYPRFLGDRGLFSRSELFLETIKLLPNSLVLVMGMRI